MVEGLVLAAAAGAVAMHGASHPIASPARQYRSRILTRVRGRFLQLPPRGSQPEVLHQTVRRFANLVSKVTGYAAHLLPTAFIFRQMTAMDLHGRLHSRRMGEPNVVSNDRRRSNGKRFRI